MSKLMLLGINKLFTLAVSNPFDVIRNVLASYKGPIQSALYTAAFVVFAVCLIAYIFGSAQLKAKMRSHIIGIIFCVILCVATGYIVDLAKDTGSHFQTILPLIQNIIPGVHFFL